MDSYELSRHAAHVRQNIVKMVTLAQSGHPGGSLSIVDMLQVLYFDVMRVDPKRPHWPDRDRFVLSKGHTVPALYATLAERGFFPEYISLTENFRITPEGITFYYNPYDIGCYALGAVDVTMSREELENL